MLTLSRLAASAWRRWFLDRQAEFWLAELGSAWSPTELRARVVEVIEETVDTRSFVLAPNRHWPGHRAGQYVPIEVELDGARVRRCYSISSGSSRPNTRHITITVKRVPGGRVSNHLHDHVRAGAILALGLPAGDFVVDQPAPLLLVAGGSGITPVIAILRDLEARDALGGVVVVHVARDDDGAIFDRELATLAMQHPRVRLVAYRTALFGRLDAQRFAALVPDLATRSIYACGPPGLIDLVVATNQPVRVERFVPPPIPRSTRATVDLRGRTLTLDGAGSLLDQLERAGERMPSGCRMGICHTCRCRKRSGIVENVLTGAISSAPDEDIQPCISIPHSDLELV
ncbi:MAG: ferredoxin reductase [Kofleriaceae bacterium]